MAMQFTSQARLTTFAQTKTIQHLRKDLDLRITFLIRRKEEISAIENLQRSLG